MVFKDGLFRIRSNILLTITFFISFLSMECERICLMLIKCFTFDTLAVVTVH